MKGRNNRQACTWKQVIPSCSDTGRQDSSQAIAFSSAAGFCCRKRETLLTCCCIGPCTSVAASVYLSLFERFSVFEPLTNESRWALFPVA
ncbi:hypothetical protein BJY01DRAFT_208927 [Aspergillus pseudoustus]|uniref:Uncharacterized protein n=1 Tax=Aspergillus pseudoustus TaxID=1810923 RepID=A0ABR4KH31_9EURO